MFVVPGLECHGKPLSRDPATHVVYIVPIKPRDALEYVEEELIAEVIDANMIKVLIIC